MLLRQDDRPPSHVYVTGNISTTGIMGMHMNDSIVWSFEQSETKRAGREPPTKHKTKKEEEDKNSLKSDRRIR
jgi:hypothetical protein